MTPLQAAQLLELPPDATPEQIETRFLELRRKIEDRIAKAPTPGLQAKYRESLAELTAAYETLALAADSSALPVLRREQGEGSREKEERGQTADDSLPRRSLGEGGRPEDGGPGERTATAKRKSGSREFVIVAVIAVIVLGAGGWWVVKTRAENEEKARIAAEQKAEAERAAEAEKARLEQAKVQLRTVLAEAKIAWEIAEREERDAERRASELRSELRGLRDATPEQRADFERRSDSAQRYSAWVRDHLLRHPLKVARAKLEELVQSGAAKDAETDGAEVRRLTQSLQTELSYHPGGEGVLNLEVDPAGTDWKLTGPGDYFQTGSGAQRLAGLLFGRYNLTFSHRTSPEKIERSIALEPGRAGHEFGVFEHFRVKFKGLRPGDRVEVDTKQTSPLPDGTFANVKAVPGGNDWVVVREGHLPFVTWLSGRDSDAEIEVAPVPLTLPALTDAFLAKVNTLEPKDRISPLTDLLRVTSGLDVMPLERRNQLLRDLATAIEEEPMPTGDAANKEVSLRASALFSVAGLQITTDREAALETARRVMQRLNTMEPAQIPAVASSYWVLAALPEVARDYARLLRPALDANPDAVGSFPGYGAALNLYAVQRMLGDTAAAEEWRTTLLTLRPQFRDSTDEALKNNEDFLLSYREALPLRAALATGNIAEFNRLAAKGASDQSFAPVLVPDLLSHGYEREAFALAASSNSTFFSRLTSHLTAPSQISLLEDYVTRMRRKDTDAQLYVAELHAIAGNLAKAKAFYAKIDNKDQQVGARDQRALTLAQMKDVAAFKTAFADAVNNKPPTSPDEQRTRLPMLYTAAASMNDFPSLTLLSERSGSKLGEFPAYWLARIGNRDSAIARAYEEPDGSFRWSDFYQLLSLRTGDDDLPYIKPTCHLPLMLHHLRALAGRAHAARNKPALTVPYARFTPPVVREGVFVPFPESMRRAALSGDAKISIEIDASGNATGYKTITTPHPDFAEAMFKAAAAKGFFPALNFGKPVPGTYEFTRTFRL